MVSEKHRKSQAVGAPGDMKLGGDRAALMTKIQGAVEEKSKSENQFSTELLGLLDKMVITGASGSQFTIKAHFRREESQWSLGQKVAMATGRNGMISYVEGEPGQETIPQLRNKLEFVKALDMYPPRGI